MKNTKVRNFAQNNYGIITLYKTAILFIIGISVLVIFRNDWKKTVYLLIFMVPFFGFIQLKILHLTGLAALVQDITIILPMYFLFILARLKKKDSQFQIRRTTQLTTHFTI